MVDVTQLAVPAYIVENRDGEGYLFVASNAAAAMLWTGKAEVSVAPMSLAATFPRAVVRRVADSYDLCLRTGQTLERDSTVPSPRGDITVRTTMYPLLASESGAPRLLCMVTDVTEERRVRDDLEQSNARLAVAMDALGGAHWFYDAVRRVFELGPSFARILGPRYQPVMTMDEWLEIVHPEDRDDQSFVDLLNGTEQQWVGEYRILDSTFGVRWLRYFRRAVTKGSLISGIAGVVIDITSEKQRETALIEQALTDPLTGLSNRRMLEQVLSAAVRDRVGLCVVMIDVDQFKAYNDSQGHVAGDAVLRRIGSAIDDVVSPLGGIVARYGGEEFTVVVPGMGQAEAVGLAESLLLAVLVLAISHPKGQSGFVTISAGSVVRTPEDRAINLIAAADAALYRAKAAGRNCHRSAEPMDCGDKMVQGVAV